MIFDNKTLNKNIPIPLHYQLKEILLEVINSGKLKENDPIPTEMELIDIFKISRPTVRQAINDLVNEGYLYRVKGKGTFAAKPKIDMEYTQAIESFDNGIKKSGLVPKTKVLELKVEDASYETASMLKIAKDSKTIKLKRLRYANNEPILIVTTYVPFSIYPELINYDFENKLLYKAFMEKNLIIKKVTRTFEARKASEHDAGLLQIETGDPIHYFESVSLLGDGMPVEYSICKFRGDRNKFVVEITNNLYTGE